jgi:glycogen debranching enzyme
MQVDSPFLALLKDRINLRQIPFTERGSRILVLGSRSQFSVRMAERWQKRDPRLSGWRERPPLLDTWIFADGTGRKLGLEITTYPHAIECRTRIGTFTISFLDSETLLVGLPPARCGISFRANLDQAETDRRGGILRLTGDIHRNVAYTTNAHILRNQLGASEHTHIVRLSLDASEGGRAMLLNLTPRLGFNRYVPDPAEALAASAARWHAWFAAVPPVADEFVSQYYFAWWVMNAGLISTRFYTSREAMTPSKIHYVGIWQWDAYFHALAYRHIDKRLAQDQLRVMIDHQREDGMIPDAVHDEGTITHLPTPVEADVTKPPLLAWAAWKLYEIDGDREFLDEIYEPVARWNRWWFEHNDPESNGLCRYEHPYSSGLDDSPLWDDGMPVESPDLNTYLCLQMEGLSKMAEALGLPAEARGWMERADALAALMIQAMWDEGSGYFRAFNQGSQPASPIDVRTPFNLLPLITGRMPAEILSRLLGHLTQEFWPRYPIPTVAIDDPHYNPNLMWRGPTWINVNYLFIDGLQRIGQAELARELRRRTLELLCRHADIYEYYNPETGANPPGAASTFGWSAALFIDLALQASRESGAMPLRAAG